jgi:alcohol dehydrogenase YqhD (iron-dependent ADH family)
LIAINTTAGTASEMTRFCIITDESRHVKMAIVDRNVTPLLSVNDPDLMIAMPKGLTAATGMDALTHAIEAYVSTAATPITDACALKAITLISHNLRLVVEDGENLGRGKAWRTRSFWRAWRSTMRPLASCMPWLTSWVASTTCPMACATQCCCPTCKASMPRSAPFA